MLDAARRLDRLGYDHLWTWDHLYAIFGDPYQPIFEGWTLAGRLRRARPSGPASGCSSAPTRSAIRASWPSRRATLDHISGGRAILGIGGAWMELEHTAHGIDFGSGFGQRLDWLDESVGAMRARARRRVRDLGARRPLRVRRPAPQPAADPAAPADHDRRQRREEDAPDRRPLRGHVERHGLGRLHGPQGRRPARALRRRRARHRRDRVHARREADDPRHRGRGRPGLEGRHGPQPDAAGRRRRRRHVLERHAGADRRPAAAVRRRSASGPSSPSSRRRTTSRRSNGSSARSSRWSTLARVRP